MKIGDKVQCVDNSETGPFLVEGAIYTVEKVFLHYGKPMFVTLQYVPGRYWIERFVKV